MQFEVELHAVPLGRSCCFTGICTVLVDESSTDSYDEVEMLDNFKKLYLSLNTSIEKKVLYRSYFEQDTWTQTTLAKDLHISPTKLKRIKEKIEKKALDLGIKWYI